MPENPDIQLIKKYTPILWFHEDDAFLPESCEIMEQVARLGKSLKKMKNFRLDEIGILKNSDEYFMDIPNIDFSNFGINANYEGQEIGQECISAYIRRRYGNNLFINPEARSVTPQFYARTTHVAVPFNNNEKISHHIQSFDPGIFGDYKIIQYYFFYLYNDSWNKHIGDWDSALEIFLKEDESHGYAIYHMHHVTWIVNMFGCPSDVRGWIQRWQEVDEKNQMGSLFHIANHPFIFVAKGAHGGYPTPGFSVHGFNAFKMKIIGQTDCRQIGELCIYPDFDPSIKDAIGKKLSNAQISARQIKYLAWGEPIVLDNQSWLKYKGLWGTKSIYCGWSGPTGPSQKSYWETDEGRFKIILSQIFKKNYYIGNYFLKIFLNWHGWK